MKMKLLLLACMFLATAVYSHLSYNSLTFCDCGDLGWRVDGYSVDQQPNNTVITMDVIRNTDPKNSGILRKVQINISNCDMQSAADWRNATTIHVSNVSCHDPHLTSIDNETCTVAMMIADHHMHDPMTNPIVLQLGGFCICSMNDELTISSDSGELSGSPESTDRNKSGSPENSNSSKKPDGSKESKESATA